MKLPTGKLTLLTNRWIQENGNDKKYNYKVNTA